MAGFESIAAVGRTIERRLNQCFEEHQPVQGSVATAAMITTEDFATVAGQSTNRPAFGASLFFYRIDLNRATARELVQLPGVGEVIAKRIVDFREEHGPFKRVEDLMKVKGIGEKSLDRIRPYIRIGKGK